MSSNILQLFLTAGIIRVEQLNDVEKLAKENGIPLLQSLLDICAH